MIFRWLGDTLITYRTAVLALMVALTLGSLALLPHLGFDFRPEAMLEFSAEEEAFAASFKERFGSENNVLLIVVTAHEGELLDAPGLTLLYRLTNELGESPIVESSYSVTSVPRKRIDGGLKALLTGGLPPPLIASLPVEQADVDAVREAVDTSHMLQGQLVSKDRTTAQIIVMLDAAYVEPVALDSEVEKVEEWVAKIVDEVGEERFEARLGGLPHVRVETIRNMKTEQLTFWPIVGACYFLLLLLIFKRPLSALIPLVSIGFATAWAVGLMVLVGQPANMINNSVPLLILVVGVCNAIHVMLRIVDGRRDGLDPAESIKRAISDVGLASFLTTLTTAIGFGSLVVAHSELLRGFGVVTAAGIMLTYIAIIVLLPLLSSLFNLRPGATHERTGPTRLERFVDTVAERLMRRPKAALAASFVLLGLGLGVGSFVDVDARVMDAFDEGHPVMVTNQLLEDKLGGILPLEVDIRGESGAFAKAETLQRVARFEQDVAEIDGVLSVMSLTAVLAEAGLDVQHGSSDAAVQSTLALIERFQPGALPRFVTPDLSNMHVSIRLPDHGVQHSLRVIEEVRALAEQRITVGASAAEGAWAGPTLAARMTGVAYLSAFGLDTFVWDLLYSLLTAIGVIFVVLVVVFRSLRVGLISLLPNLLPLSLTLAAVPLFGYSLNTTTAVVFTITIGLAVDNSIHIIARFKGEWAVRRDVEESVRAAFRSAGRAIVLSNLLLMGGLSVLMFSDFEPLRRISLLAITTIAAALFACMLVLPAELKLLGRGIVDDSAS